MEAIEFLGFGLHAWITIVTVLTMFTVLLFTKRIMGMGIMGSVLLITF